MTGLSDIEGIGATHAEKLAAAGLDTVVELAQRNAANLAARRMR